MCRKAVAERSIITQAMRELDCSQEDLAMPAQHHRCASSQDIARYAAVDSAAHLGSLSLQVKAASMKQHMLWRVSLQ